MSEQFLPVSQYDLAATLSSGQAFRWTLIAGHWEGVVGNRWVRLKQVPNGITVQVMGPVSDWRWLTTYLQLDFDFPSALHTFPHDPALTAAVSACPGLRLLRQDPWETLASFILSSTKQIVQIQQIISALSKCLGTPLPVPAGHAPVSSFPSARTIAEAPEAQLRGCKMGFRAPNLKATAQIIAAGNLDLAALQQLPLAQARERLVELPGVGRKIADCVLLFAYDFPQAFPIDVWVKKALIQLYFQKKRKPDDRKLRAFSEKYFGPHAGLAQQYLFHYMRVRSRAPRESSQGGSGKTKP